MAGGGGGEECFPQAAVPIDNLFAGVGWAVENLLCQKEQDSWLSLQVSLYIYALVVVSIGIFEAWCKEYDYILLHCIIGFRDISLIDLI